ncbi:MAG TPA: hypothetical protein ENL08_00955 [Bacteroidetes bacterium]|nr:hypothetical protein [Bacteroidota bacterium]
MSRGRLIRAALPVFLLAVLGCEGDVGRSGVSLLPADIWAPEVVLLLPEASRFIYDRVAVEAYAVDDTGVDSVEFLIDGVVQYGSGLVMRDYPWQTLWDCSGIAEGSHSIQARAWDGAGHYGLSNVVIVNKTDPALKPAEADLRSYIETSDEDEMYLWKLPDTLGGFNGFGARFVPDGPCRIENFFVTVYWDENWTGTGLFAFEIWNSVDNIPDSLLCADTTFIDYKRAEKGMLSSIKFIRRADRIYVQGDFFVLVTPAEEQPVDTLGLITDNGSWRNYHGVARRDGEWVPFTAGPFTAFNPFISAVVAY